MRLKLKATQRLVLICITVFVSGLLLLLGVAPVLVATWIQKIESMVGHAIIQHYDQAFETCVVFFFVVAREGVKEAFAKVHKDKKDK